MNSLISLVLIATILFSKSDSPVPPQESFPCALSLASQLEDPSQRASALIEIAKFHLKAGDRAAADRLLRDSLDSVAQTERGLFRAGRLGDVLEIASREHLVRAQKIGKSITGSDGIRALRQLMLAHARFGLNDQANELLSEGIRRTITRSKKEVWYGDQDFELALLLGDAATAGLVPRALRVARTIRDPFVRANVLHPAAIKLAEDKQGLRALSVARSIHYEIERIDALVDVANAVMTTGDKAVAAAALSLAITETSKDIFDSGQDTQTKALVSISLAYYNLGQKITALALLGRAERVAYTIEKPGFRDSGLSQVALAYARYGDFDKALGVSAKIPSDWSDLKSNTLAAIGSYLFAANQRDRAIAVVGEGEQIARNIDCTYFKYGISARSCFGLKVSDFLKIASAYEQGNMLDKDGEALDMAVKQNKFKVNPPHQIVEEGSSVIADYPVSELEIVEGYLAAGQLSKAIELASTIADAKVRVVAVATIEFTMTKQNLAARKGVWSSFGC